MPNCEMLFSVYLDNDTYDIENNIQQKETRKRLDSDYMEQVRDMNKGEGRAGG